MALLPQGRYALQDGAAAVTSTTRVTRRRTLTAGRARGAARPSGVAILRHPTFEGRPSSGERLDPHLASDLRIVLMPTIDSENTSTELSRCAGDFQSWLQDTVGAFSYGQGVSVPCGDCKACCRAGYFIPVHRQECSTRAVIPARLLVTPPAHHGDGGYQLISTTRRGYCALLRNGACSIYRERPQACRDYDCRLFAASGLPSGHGEIDRQIARWRFHYDSEEGLRAHAAIRSAARFVIEHAQAFPEGRVPQRPLDVTVVALKSHHVFLDPKTQSGDPEAIAKAIVQACRAFDATGRLPFAITARPTTMGR